MNGPSQEIALARFGLLYKVKDSIVKIAFIDNEEINEYLTRSKPIKGNISTIVGV